MHTYGYFAAALIGISLGMIGGGGSILTVPVLVYLFGVTPVLATSYSLFVVGSSSLAGAIRNFRKKQIDIHTALLFGCSSIVTVFLVRKCIVPHIPKTLFTIDGFAVLQSTVTMVLFALLMLAASLSMIRGSRQNTNKPPKQKPTVMRLAAYGISIGIVTGLLGAGGGFLIVPTLVLIVGLEMKTAVGTSLLIIAMNSLIGFTGDIGTFHTDWRLLLTVTAIAIAGIFIGSFLGQKISNERLKKIFGWFVFAMGIYIIVKEIFLK